MTARPKGKPKAMPVARRVPRKPATKRVVAPAAAPMSALPLARELAKLIVDARGRLAHAANAALTTLYWQIGSRIRRDVLAHRRAAYGAEIVAALGRQLEARSPGSCRRRRVFRRPSSSFRSTR